MNDEHKTSGGVCLAAGVLIFLFSAALAGFVFGSTYFREVFFTLMRLMPRYPQMSYVIILFGCCFIVSLPVLHVLNASANPGRRGSPVLQAFVISALNAAVGELFLYRPLNSLIKPMVFDLLAQADMGRQLREFLRAFLLFGVPRTILLLPLGWRAAEILLSGGGGKKNDALKKEMFDA